MLLIRWKLQCMNITSWIVAKCVCLFFLHKNIIPSHPKSNIQKVFSSMKKIFRLRRRVHFFFMYQLVIVTDFQQTLPPYSFNTYLAMRLSTDTFSHTFPFQEQYGFVYNALAEGFATGTTSIPCRQMAQVMSNFTADGDSKDDTIEKQFQVPVPLEWKCFSIFAKPSMTNFHIIHFFLVFTC